LKKETNNKF